MRSLSPLLASILLVVASGCSLAGLSDLRLPACESDRDCEALDRGLPADGCVRHACDLAKGRCAVGVVDDDGDGEAPVRCGGGDCDDGDPAVRSGAVELCGNEVDEDCDGVAGDLDCDGSLAIAHGGGDCDDGDPHLGPHAREACNGVDDDCDGLLDGPGEDDDGDGHADECAGPAATDCDDSDTPEGRRTYFGAQEVCDGLDNDCLLDGLRRSGGGPRPESSEDRDGDGHSSPNADCFEVGDDGTEHFPRDDCDDGDPLVYAGAFELCDGLDNDCDGVPDNEPGEAGSPGGACRVVLGVAAGAGHTCIARHDGTAVCWGLGTAGQLGIEEPEPFDAVLVPDLLGLESVAAGEGGSCGVHDDSGVTCWGARTLTVEGRAAGSAVARVAVDGATEVSVGAGHACAVTVLGEVLCWGTSGAGEIDGETVDRIDATGLLPGHLPAPVPGIDDAARVDAGLGSSCAVRSGGGVFCWGDNSLGQLGDGTTDGPARADVLDLSGARQVAVGDGFACALRNDGTVACWGRRLGAAPGDEGFDAAPVDVAGLAGVVEIRAGTGRHVCARTATRRIVCWGDNAHGQLGDPFAGERSATPVPVSGASDAEQLSVGRAHACFVSEAGQVSCWGENAHYELGQGEAGLGVDRPVPVSVIVDAMQIEDACFRLPHLTVRCADPSLEPDEADGPIVDLSVASYHRLSVPSDHRCFVGLDGEVRCVGSDMFGQLGRGETLRETVVGLVDATDVACGERHCCAVRRTGRVVCWGSNLSGQLGTDATDLDQCFGDPCAREPVRAEGVVDARRVIAGRGHSCALLQDGTVTCWGDNREGQVGASAPASVRLPLPVEGLPEGDPVAQIAAAAFGELLVGEVVGGDATCAVLESGAVYCWGAPLGGVVGGGPDPRRLVGLDGAVQVAMTRAGLCARLGSGAIRCSMGIAGLVADVGRIWDARDLGCGTEHCCLTRTSGQSLCWGLVPPGLGVPSPTTEPLPVRGLL